MKWRRVRLVLMTRQIRLRSIPPTINVRNSWSDLRPRSLAPAREGVHPDRRRCRASKSAQARSWAYGVVGDVALDVSVHRTVFAAVDEVVTASPCSRHARAFALGPR